MVIELPPKERAALVLKDVLDCSLEETAEITQSNVGAVKAALHRAREKLRNAEALDDVRREPLAPEKRAVIANYIEAFNRRDWDAVRAIVSDDARLEVIDRTDALFRTARYLSNYAALATPWLLELAFVDGQEHVVHYRKVDDEWLPRAIVKIDVTDGRVSRIRDYLHVDYLLRFCDVARAGADGGGGGAEGG